MPKLRSNRYKTSSARASTPPSPGGESLQLAAIVVRVMATVLTGGHGAVVEYLQLHSVRVLPFQLSPRNFIRFHRIRTFSICRLCDSSQLQRNRPQKGSTAPATVPRRAGPGLQPAPACVQRHLPNESEDSRSREPTGPGGLCISRCVRCSCLPTTMRLKWS